ncbi:MAG: acyl-CoA-binding protein [Chitinophagaceae bacterium]|jgi:acyl-CoA-binding protein
MNLEEQFEDAVASSKLLKEKPDNETLLMLYSLYKQATDGDTPVKGEYGMFDFVAKAKHEAWLKISGKPKEEAMREYILLIEKLRAEN